MKSILVVCEYVSVNPDGTFGMLRGGLNRLQLPKLPSVLGLGFLVRLTAEFGEEGDHDFKLVVVDYDGQEMAKAEGRFAVTTEQRIVNVGINMPINFMRKGRASARLIIDKQMAADWDLEVIDKPAPVNWDREVREDS